MSGLALTAQCWEAGYYFYIIETLMILNRRPEGEGK